MTGSRPTSSFIVGLNLPWLTYGLDFGHAERFGWSDEGISRAPEKRARLARTLRAASASGVDVVRVWIFGDGRGGLRFDDGGRLLGMHPSVEADFEGLLAEADTAQIAILPVVLDYTIGVPQRRDGGGRMPDRVSLLTEASGFERLAEEVVRPLVARFGDHPRIYAWELINEPAWMLRRRAMRYRAIAPALERMAEVIHAHSARPVSLGTADGWALKKWTAVLAPGTVDRPQLHHYGARLPDRASLGVGRAFLGEFATAGRNARMPVEAMLAHARALGFEGGFPWSALDDDQSDPARLPSLLEAIARFRAGSPV